MTVRSHVSAPGERAKDGDTHPVLPGLLSPRHSIQDKVLMFESTKAGQNVG